MLPSRRAAPMDGRADGQMADDGMDGRIVDQLELRVLRRGTRRILAFQRVCKLTYRLEEMVFINTVRVG